MQRLNKSQGEMYMQGIGIGVMLNAVKHLSGNLQRQRDPSPSLRVTPMLTLCLLSIHLGFPKEEHLGHGSPTAMASAFTLAGDRRAYGARPQMSALAPHRIYPDRIP